MKILFIVDMHFAVHATSLASLQHATETKVTNIPNKRNMVETPHWQEADDYLQSVTEDLNSAGWRLCIRDFRTTTPTP